MIVFCSTGPGGATPPAWLATIAGSAFIVYCAYRISRDWRDLTGGDLAVASGFLIVGGLILFEGVTMLLRR